MWFLCLLGQNSTEPAGPGSRTESAPKVGDDLKEDDRILREIEALRSLLSSLSKASLRITEDLDLGRAE